MICTDTDAATCHGRVAVVHGTSARGSGKKEAEYSSLTAPRRLTHDPS